MNEVIQAAAELQGVCQSQGWQFCFIGGLALQRWSEPRETVDVDLSLFVGFLVSAWLFLRTERRAEAPMVNLKLFQNHTLSIAVATGFLSFVAIGGYFTVLPFYLENVMGLDPAASGRMLAVSPLVLGVVAPVAGMGVALVPASLRRKSKTVSLARACGAAMVPAREGGAPS